MPSNNTRYNLVFILTHWALALLIFISLGLGWSIQYIPLQSNITRKLLLNLHISFGLTIAIVLFIQLVLRIIFRPPPYPNGFPRLQRISSSIIYSLIYISIILMLLSGYLQAIFSGTTVQFWGASLPNWDVAEMPTAEFFGSAHRVLAFVLAGLIVAHIANVGLNIFKHPGFASRMLFAGQEPGEPSEARSPIASNVVQGLAKNLRRFGWLAFWLQLVLALISGVLLEFATSGRAFSPSTAGGFGDGVYWGIAGFVLLWLAILLAFFYTRAARRIIPRPDFYLIQTGLITFWFLSAGTIIGFLGVLTSFVGVAVSISLLIVKTVSQPPGIAITDPSKIVRALDVFILIVNFDLLAAHCIGLGTALWLGIGVQRARLKYMSIGQQEVKNV
jgi:cytochrome b561